MALIYAFRTSKFGGWVRETGKKPYLWFDGFTTNGKSELIQYHHRSFVPVEGQLPEVL